MRASGRRLSNRPPSRVESGLGHAEKSSLMLRSSFASPFVVALALTPSVAFGQGAPPGAAPSAPPTAAPPASAPPPGRAAPIDRGSLLEPAPSTRTGVQGPVPAAPAPEPREAERSRDASIGANPREVFAEDWWVRS